MKFGSPFTGAVRYFQPAGSDRVPIRFSWRAFWAALGSFLAALLVFFLLRSQVAERAPALMAAGSIALFLLPGFTLSVWFLPEDSMIERLPDAFLLSLGVLIAPGVLVMTVHLSLKAFILIFVGIAAISVISLGFYAGLHPSKLKKFTSNGGLTHTLLWLVLIFMGAVLFIIALRIPLIGDDWAGMPFLQNFLTSDHVNLYEPFHGTGLPATTRTEFSVWGLDFALLSKIANLNPLTIYSYIRPILVLIAILAFLNLAHQVLPNRTAAVFVTILWMLILLSSISWGETGYDLLVRVNQDKYALRYILLPVTLRLLLRIFQTKQLRYLFFFGLAGWAVGGTHPMGPVLIGLPCLGFGLVHLIHERNKVIFIRLGIAALGLGAGLILPFIQLIGVSKDWLAFELVGATDVNLLTRLGMATRTHRLLLLQNGNYALHPAVVLEWLNLLAFICLPLLIRWSWRKIQARLLLGTLVLVPLMLFLPWTSRAIGGLITPWLLYRLAWSIPLAAVIAVGWFLWVGIEWGISRFPRFQLQVNSPSLVFAAVLLLIATMLSRQISIGQRYIEDLRQDSERAECQEVRPLLEHLPEILQQDSVFLATQDLNFCIPAFSPYAKVIEYRWTTTLSRFPANRRDEALQRIQDMLYYTANNYVDEKLAAILDRYNVRYILIRDTQMMTVQLMLLPDWFTPLLTENGYTLYKVADQRASLPIVAANTALSEGDPERANNLYTDLIGTDSKTTTLAYYGLGELYLSRGNLNQAVEMLKNAAVTAPSAGLIKGALASTLLTAHRAEEAVVIFNQALTQIPQNIIFLEQMGHAYRLMGQDENARISYKKAAGLQAPAGSAQWYQALAAYYLEAGWDELALEAYQSSLAILPDDLAVEISLGDIYYNQGDMDKAREAYRRAQKINRWSAQPAVRFGILAEDEGKPDEAIKYYKSAIRSEPVRPTAYLLLAAAEAEAHGGEAAIQAIQALPGYKLLLPGPLLASGMLYANQGRFDQAVSELNQTINRFPLDTNRVNLYLANLYISTGNRKAAEDIFQQVLSSDITLVEDANLGLGELASEEARRDQALGNFFKAVRENPASPEVHLDLGNEYARQMLRDQANTEFQIATTFDPDYLEGYLAMGELSLSAGNDEDAFSIYNMIKKHFPGSLEGYLGLARLYEKQGEHSAAERTIQEAISSNPGSAAFHTYLARFYLDEGQIGAALAEHLKAIQLDPKDLPTQRAYGFFLLSQKASQDAVNALETALQEKPGDIYTRLGLAKALLTTGDFDNALQQLISAAESSGKQGSAYVTLGDEYNRRGEWELAAGAYQKAALSEPTLPEAYTHLGKLYEIEGQPEAALSEYRRATYMAPSSPVGWTALSGALFVSGDLDGARVAASQAVAIEPGFIDAYRWLGKIDQAQGLSGQALVAYQKAVDQNPGTASAWQLLSDYWRQQGQWDRALAASQQAMAAEPGNISAQIGTGSLYQAQGKWQEATEYYLHAIELEPGNPAGYLSLGNLLTAQGNFQEAEKIYRVAGDVDKSSPEASLHLGNLYLRQGESQKAAEYFRQSIETQPSFWQAYLGLALAYQIQGRMNQALEQLEKAAKVAPASAEVQVRLAEIYKSQGRWADAEQALLRAVGGAPGNPLGWSSIGNYYETQGRMQDAEQTYQEAAQHPTAEEAALVDLGELFLKQRKVNEALAVIQRAVDKSPNSIPALMTLGNLFQARSDREPARNSYETAIRIDPLYLEGYLALGTVYEAAGDFLSAQSTYQLALELDPTDARTYLALGELMEAQDDGDTAEAYYQEGIALNPTGEDLYVHLGSLLASAGRWGQALEAYQAALRIIPGSAVIRAQLGELYLDLARLDEAQQEIERAQKLDQSNPDVYVLLGELFQKKGEFTKAAAWLEKGIAVSPTYLDVYSSLGKTYQMAGDFSEAEAAFSQGVQQGLNQPGAYLERASFYATNGKWEAARQDYESAWNLDPTSEAVGLQWTGFLLRRGDVEQAETVLKHLAGLPGVSARVQTELGGVYTLQADWKAAQTAFETAIQGTGSRTAAYAGLARTYILTGDPGTALELFRTATSVMPHDPQAWINLGEAYLKQMDLDAASGAFAQAVALDPENTTALIDLDDLMRRTGSEGIDLSDLIERAKNAPTSSRCIRLAFLYQKRGMWNAAEYWYKKAVELDPFRGESWAALGKYYQSLHLWDQAVDALEQALKYEPGSASDLLALGAVQDAMGSRRTAQAAYWQVVDAAPAWFEGYRALAESLAVTYQMADAVQLMNAWIAKYPGSDEGYAVLSRLFTMSGNYHGSVEIILSGLERMPGSALLFVELGNSYIGSIAEMRGSIEMDRARALWMDYLLDFFDQQIQTAQNKLEHHLAEFHYKRVVNVKLDLEATLAQAEQAAEQLTSDHTARANEAFQRALELEPSNLLARSGLGHLADALGQPENSIAFYEDILAVDPNAEIGLMTLASAYLEQDRPQEAIGLFQKILFFDPANEIGNYGLFKAYRGLKQPTVTQAASTVEYSIPTWDDLFKYSKEKSGY